MLIRYHVGDLLDKRLCLCGVELRICRGQRSHSPPKTQLVRFGGKHLNPLNLLLALFLMRERQTIHRHTDTQTHRQRQREGERQRERETDEMARALVQVWKSQDKFIESGLLPLCGS